MQQNIYRDGFLSPFSKSKTKVDVNLGTPSKKNKDEQQIAQKFSMLLPTHIPFFTSTCKIGLFASFRCRIDLYLITLMRKSHSLSHQFNLLNLIYKNTCNEIWLPLCTVKGTYTLYVTLHNGKVKILSPSTFSSSDQAWRLNDFFKIAPDQFQFFLIHTRSLP